MSISQYRFFNRRVLYLLIVLIVILLAYSIIQGGIQNQRVQAAEQIEATIQQACNIQVDVDPASVSVYDVAYWSSAESVNSGSEAEEMLITCSSARDNQWRCSCEENPQ
jgi:hypothetical protein